MVTFPNAVWADIFLSLHALFIVFVVLGFILIVAGKICPLTTWENDMREVQGGRAYPSTFVGYYLQKIIYYDFPLWVFAMGYTAFTVIVLMTWIIRPPRWPRFKSDNNQEKYLV